ncbi:hypothetical protein PP714_10435 [Lacticaseibacillus paracasei]|nr:hypothetical protein [Lacticaseibacillus paracasei]
MMIRVSVGVRERMGKMTPSNVMHMTVSIGEREKTAIVYIVMPQRTGTEWKTCQCTIAVSV